ncbi:MAG: ABC transporter permease [Armatimonas sp.]
MNRRELPLLIALVALVCLVSAFQPRFLSVDNLRSVLLWLPLLTVAALGQMAVILTRGVDVSVGSILALAGMCTAVLLRDHPNMNIYVAALLSTVFGAVLGAINGGLIAFGRVPAIVATLGTLGIYRGLTFLVSKGQQVSEYELPRGLATWSNEGPGGQSLIPWVVLLALLCAGE